MNELKLLAVSVAALMIGIFIGVKYKQSYIDKLKADHKLAFQYWDQKVGGTTLWNGEMVNYNLRTFDGGRTWYQVEFDDEWRMKILGNVADLFPGLIETLDGIDALTDHVRENGAITLKDGLHGQEAQLLRSAGFDVMAK